MDRSLERFCLWAPVESDGVPPGSLEPGPRGPEERKFWNWPSRRRIEALRRRPSRNGLALNLYYVHRCYFSLAEMQEGLQTLPCGHLQRAQEQHQVLLLRA